MLTLTSTQSPFRSLIYSWLHYTFTEQRQLQAILWTLGLWWQPPQTLPSWNLWCGCLERRAIGARTKGRRWAWGCSAQREKQPTPPDRDWAEPSPEDEWVFARTFWAVRTAQAKAGRWEQARCPLGASKFGVGSGQRWSRKEGQRLYHGGLPEHLPEQGQCLKGI